jgi:hypothetical protein
MHPAMIVAFFRTAVGMCCTGAVVLLIGAWAAKDNVAQARGLDKIVALRNLCFAAPLADFGALHLFGPQFAQRFGARYTCQDACSGSILLAAR